MPHLRVGYFYGAQLIRKSKIVHHLPIGPFLRWAGGKQQIIDIIVANLPEDLDNRRYIEPFLGAGSVFFAARPRRAIISDSNFWLIEAYRGIKRDPEGVRLALKRLISQHSKENYYRIRDQYNNCNFSTATQAARFIYLNKTCFNGIFRVNQSGKFNVPKGSKDNVSLPSSEEFSGIASVLQHTRILSKDYGKILEMTAGGDFVYVDPPYPALNATAYFDHYTVDRFGDEAQQCLSHHLKKLDRLGARFLMSNADVPSIRALYRGFDIQSIPVRRFVNCKGIRTQVSELIIRNY